MSTLLGGRMRCSALSGSTVSPSALAKVECSAFRSRLPSCSPPALSRSGLLLDLVPHSSRVRLLQTDSYLRQRIDNCHSINKHQQEAFPDGAETEGCTPLSSQSSALSHDCMVQLIGRTFWE